MTASEELRYPKPEALLQVPDYGHVVIEASAGTGKTYTIEHLVVDLLVTQGVRINEILVVTFTEKATTELKRRLRTKLRELLGIDRTTTDIARENCWILNEQTRRKLELALVDFDSASIETIHGFCHGILMENAFLNGRLFHQQHVDERTVFGRAFKNLLRAELALSAELMPYLAAWLEIRQSSVDALEELLYQASRTHACLAPVFDPGRLASAVEDLPLLATSRQELTDEGIHKSSIAKILRNLESLRQAIGDYQCTRDLAALVAELDDIELSYLSRKLEGFAEIGPALDRLAASAVSLPAALVDRFLPLVEERLALMKREKGLFDFRDMLSLVARSLDGRHGGELARLIRSRYKYVLIDEFQDTDELQWDIFQKLFFVGGAQTPLRLVGDPKQAIYGFRGADVRVYLAARSALVARSAMVPLVENFRSTPELIEGLNLLFDQRAEKPFFTGNIRYDIAVRPGRPELRLVGADLSPRGPIVLFRTDDKKALAACIAEEIQALTQDDSKRLLFGADGEEQPIGPEDIFVLTRTGREADRVAEALAARGVPCAFYKRDGLFQTREAEEIRNLLESLAHPHDRSMRLGAWMTSFFGLSLRELEQCTDVPSSHPLMRRLSEWRTLAEAKDFETLFARILEQSGVLRRELFSGDGERAMVNYVHIFEILLEEVGETGATLGELVRTLKRYIDGRGLPAGSDRNVMRLETDRAVQVMTMHMSKGLEAAVVFLYAFSGGRSDSIHSYCDDGGKKAYVGKLAEAPQDVKNAVERERREEDQRLLYVAATRAKARLYLPLMSKNASGLGCYAQLNCRLLEQLGAFEIVDAIAPGGPDEDAIQETVRLDDWEPPREHSQIADTGPLFDALRYRHRGLVVTSYSRMKSLRGNYRAPIEEPIAFEEGALPGGSATGIFLHEVLEHLDFGPLKEGANLESWRVREDVRELFRRALRRNGVDPRFRPEAERLVHTALTSPVTLGEHLIEYGFASLETELREVEFAYPYPEQGGELRRGFVKGFVDFVFELEGRTYLCDWKSDVLPAWGDDAVSKHVRVNYTLQAKLYTLALVKMLGIENEHDNRTRFGGIVYCFLRGRPDGGIYFERPSWDTIAAWTEELVRETRL